MVRLAFVTSVTWRPVSRQISHESIVPKSTSRPRSPSTLSSSQRSFGPEKYVDGGRPVRSRNHSVSSSRTRSAVRVSCQTIA